MANRRKTKTEQQPSRMENTGKTNGSHRMDGDMKEEKTSNGDKNKEEEDIENQPG